MSKQEKSTVFGGAAILAVGIAIVKFIGFLYKIPLFSLIGDEGTGHFNNAYVIYNLLLMVSTAGLPVALSKTISEANALGRRAQVRRLFNVSLATFFVLGMVTFLVMFFSAGPLAEWQGNGLAMRAVQALAPACLFVCVLSAFRGYAQGHGNMVPTSVSQIIEALGKLFIGLGLAWYLVSQGARSEDSAAGAIFGVTAGAFVSLLFLIFDHLAHRRRETWRRSDTPDPHGAILRRLLIIAVPITIGASVVPVTTWLDTVQVQNILRDLLDAQPAQYYKDFDLIDPVVATYGAYQKAIAVYNLPSSFMVALTASVIPAISACRALRDRVGAGRIAESSLRIAAILALPAGVGLTVLAEPIVLALFGSDTDLAVAVPCMAILGVASVFVCITLLCNSILQANGFVNIPIFIMATGCVAKLLVNYVLVRAIGIAGAPVGTLVCYAIVSLLALLTIRRVIPCPPRYGRVFSKPLLAASIMGGAVWVINGVSTRILLGVSAFSVYDEALAVASLSRAGAAVSLVLSIGVGMVLYFALLLFLRTISKEDLSLMPKGEKIAKFLRIHW